MIELLFVIYLLSGTLKGILFAFQIRNEIDVTVLTALLLLVALAAKLFTRKDAFDLKRIMTKDRFQQLIPVLLFYAWCLFTLTYDKSSYPNFAEDGNAYGFRKAFYFLTCLLPLLVLFTFPELNILRFFRIYIAASIAISVFFLLFTPVNCEFVYPGQSLEGRMLSILEPSFVQANFPGFYSSLQFDYGIVASGHLTVALLLGTSLLMLLAFPFNTRTICLAIVLFFLLMSSDGRGPSLLLVLSLLVYAGIRLYQRLRSTPGESGSFRNRMLHLGTRVKKIRRQSVLTISAFSLLLVAMIFLSPTITGLYKKSLSRYLGIVHYIDSNEVIDSSRYKELNFDEKYRRIPHLDTSIMARELHFKNSIKLIFSDVRHFLVGYGFGNYAKASPFALTVDDHPHNVLLEIAVETGFIGLVLFLWFLTVVVLYARKGSLVMAIILLYLFLNCLKSVPLVDRNTFAFYGLVLFTATRLLHEGKQENLSFV